MAKRLSRAMELEIVNAYKKTPEGATLLGRRFGIGSSTIFRVLERNGIERDPAKMRGNPGYRHFKFDSDTYHAIVSAYLSGEPAADIERRFDCCRATILDAVRRSGEKIQRRGGQLRPWSESEIQEMARLYRAGKSQQNIARRFDTDQRTVSRLLRSQGIVARAGRERHGNWRGGRSVTRHGYASVLVEPDSQFASMRMGNGYVLEHRLVMAQSLGRPLRIDETVHHINGNKTDNRLENLQLRTGKHGKHEAFQCADCGSRNIVAVQIS